LLCRAVARQGAGTYVIQAAIADLHLQQPRDWHQIAALYGTLAKRTGSPVVELNRAVAIAELDGPDAGLALLDTLTLDDYRYYHSTRADLLRRAGRTGDARAAYARAFELAETDPERQFLARQLEERPAWPPAYPDSRCPVPTGRQLPGAVETGISPVGPRRGA
jgi:RNA polymerase sigma-70 factor (ECF subfamily)